MIVDIIDIISIHTFIDRIYNPDFIVVEQTYNRFDISEVKCPVIYIHREYTHFVDIETPDMLLGSYPNRLQTFEFYNPWNYNQIQYQDDLYVAVDQNDYNPNRDKIIKGITMISWSTNPYNFANANGIFARMVIEDQVAFYQDCIKKGYITYVKGGNGARYKDLLEQCEAVLIDGGYINGFGRRLFEAMASKTLCIIRVHGVKTMEIYKNMGLTDEMCYFIYNPEDIPAMYTKQAKERRLEKIEKAYEWVTNNHTYDIRANQLIEKFEEFKNGKIKKVKFMGYATHSDGVEIQSGELIHRQIV